MPDRLVIATRDSRPRSGRPSTWLRSFAKCTSESMWFVPMTTQGDRIIDRSLSEVGGKGLFILEIEVRAA